MNLGAQLLEELRSQLISRSMRAVQNDLEAFEAVGNRRLQMIEIVIFRIGIHLHRAQAGPDRTRKLVNLCIH
ncbi:hypothetical protein D3C71_1952350 [compost metagenome]